MKCGTLIQLEWGTQSQTQKDLFKIFTATGAVGGAIGAVGGARTVQLERAQKIAEAIILDEPVEINGKMVEHPQKLADEYRVKLARVEMMEKRASKNFN